MTSETHSGFTKILGRVDVFLLGVVATFNLNLVPTIAGSGKVMLPLMLAAVLLFVIPQAIAVVQINRRFPGEGGMAEWVSYHFGDFWGFLTAWCYWGINVVYVPTLILFFIGNLSFLLQGNQSSESLNTLPIFLAALVLLWLIVGLSVVGFGVSRWLSNAGGIGMLTALVVLLTLCGWSMATGRAVQADVMPSLAFDWSSVATFGVICMALVGPELGTVIGDEIQESRSVVPWSVWRVAILAAVCYTLGAGVLQLAVPTATIHSVQGVLAAAQSIAEPLEAQWLVSLLGTLICVSVIGASVTWFAGASRMLWVAAHDGSLPAPLATLSPRFGTPVAALVLQGVLSTAILAISFVGSQAQQVFTTLVDLSVVLQLIPFLTLFVGLFRAGLVERNEHSKVFMLAGAAGALASLAGILLAFVPSRQVESVWMHELNLIGGCVLFVGSCVVLFAMRRKPTNMTNEPEA